MLTVYTPGPSTPASSAPAPGTADVILFPDGVVLRGVPEPDLAATVVGALAGGEVARRPGAAAGPGLAWESVPPLTLLVCSHMARDKRCGVLGPQLAARLEQLLAGRSLGRDQATVLKVSHVGAWGRRAAVGRGGAGRGRGDACLHTVARSARARHRPGAVSRRPTPWHALAAGDPVASPDSRSHLPPVHIFPPLTSPHPTHTAALTTRQASTCTPAT